MHERNDCYSLPPITSVDVMKLAWKYWRGLDQLIRDGWKLRADTINRLPPYGAFSEVPTSITSDTILYSVNEEYARICSMLSTLSMKGTNLKDYWKSKMFGLEKVFLANQIFRSFHFNFILKEIIFGTNFSRLYNKEIVYQTKGVVVLYIYSSKRIGELFTLNGRNPFLVIKGRRSFEYRSKVLIVEKATNKEGVRTVTNEIDEMIECTLQSGLTVAFRRPFFDNKLKKWAPVSNDDYILKQLDPIRLKLFRKSGFCHMTYNKNKLRNGNK